MTLVVSRYLGTEPTTLTELAARMHVPRREAERFVQEARLAGVPLVSDGDGVRLARDATEAAQCAARLRRRAITQLLTARALRRAAQRMTLAEGDFEQTAIWG